MTKHYPHRPSIGSHHSRIPRHCASTEITETVETRSLAVNLPAMNLLVTGGAGFVGSHFVRAVLTDRLPGLEGASVTVLDRITYAGSTANLHAVSGTGRLTFLPADIRDTAVIGAALRRHDAVVHFAAETAEAADLVATNVTGTQVMLDAALRLGIPRFVQISTAEVYGSLDAGAWTERSPLAPTTPYAASKAGADLLALTYHRSHGLPVVVVRAGAVYGTYQHPAYPLPRLITSALAGLTVEMPAGEGPVRDWLHVGDHCRAVALVLRSGAAGETYHVGGSVELSHHDLAALVLDECGTGWTRVVTVDEPPGSDHRRALDDERIRRDLGWRPQTEFADGVAETVRWYRDNPGWWRPLLP
jgi:dTDP-glucose 4,6-dehydratase